LNDLQELSNLKKSVTLLQKASAVTERKIKGKSVKSKTVSSMIAGMILVRV